MRHIYIVMLLLLTATSSSLLAQDDTEIQTLFNGTGIRSGGYGAITNSFTSINGEFANMVGIHGGWYINQRFLLGVGGSALTSNLRVPQEYSVDVTRDMSYHYSQFGLVTEYVPGSNRAIHVAFQLFAGSGLTLQYERYYPDVKYEAPSSDRDINFFLVVEPGVRVELNILKWMRFSPGISYRIVNGSDARGLSDKDLSATSVNMTLKFGRF